MGPRASGVIGLPNKYTGKQVQPDQQEGLKQHHHGLTALVIWQRASEANRPTMSVQELIGARGRKLQEADALVRQLTGKLKQVQAPPPACECVALPTE